MAVSYLFPLGNKFFSHSKTLSLILAILANHYTCTRFAHNFLNLLFCRCCHTNSFCSRRLWLLAYLYNSQILSNTLSTVRNRKCSLLGVARLVTSSYHRKTDKASTYLPFSSSCIRLLYSSTNASYNVQTYDK